MLREEFNRLVQLFEDGAAGKPIDLNAVFSQSLDFFNHLRVQIETGGPDEKKEAMTMMSELYQRMMVETKKLCEHAGFSEEQLMAYAENPANFAPEQWRAIQESKEKIAQAGHELAKTIYEKGKEGLPLPEKKEQTKPKKQNRSDWLRS